MSLAAIRAPSTLAESGLTYKLLAEARIGHGAVAWLAIGPSARGLSAGGARALRIDETDVVTELRAENLGREPVLLAAHVVVRGGKQTRTVERSVIVPARATVTFPVKCVEAGRWARRPADEAEPFEVSESTAVRTRSTLTASRTTTYRTTGSFIADQRTVWSHVDDEITRSHVTSQTRSYEAYLDGVKQKQIAEARRAEIVVPTGANAALLLLSDGTVWLEALADPILLATEVHGLLADLFGPAPADAWSQRTAADAMATIWAALLEPIEPVAETLGEAYAVANGRVHGELLELEGALVHLGVAIADSAAP